MRLVLEIGDNRHLTDTSWSRLKAIVKRRDKAICQYCGTKDENGQVDHIIPLSRGGTDKLENLAWSCAKCNQRKNARLPMIYPQSRPIFRLLLNNFLEALLSKLVGRYGNFYEDNADGHLIVYTGFGEGQDTDLNEYRAKIEALRAKLEAMQSQRIRDWVRKTVWPDEYPTTDDAIFRFYEDESGVDA